MSKYPTNPLFKKLTAHKQEWLKNNSKHMGAQNEVIRILANKEADNELKLVIVNLNSQKHGRAWAYMNDMDLLALIKKDLGIYEVIRYSGDKVKCKVYFDVDKYSSEPINGIEFLQATKNHILVYFPNAIMAISGSTNIYNETKKLYKTSYHIVVNNYLIKNSTDNEILRCITLHINKKESSCGGETGFDETVYSKNRNMKCINQSKRDDDRIQQILEIDDHKQHLITCFFSDESLPYKQITTPVEDLTLLSKSKAPFDLKLIPRMDKATRINENIDITTLTPIQLLESLPIDNSQNHEYTHRIARFCYYNNIVFDSFLSWIRNKHTHMGVDIKTKWVYHWENLVNFPPVSIEQIHTILYKIYPKLKKNIKLKIFKDAFLLPSKYIENIESIAPLHYEIPNKYICFNVGMGSGKTAQTIDYLKQRYSSLLWIAPKITLINNTYERIIKSGILIKKYSNYSSIQDRTENTLSKQHQLIICINSLFHLNGRPYDTVVIDEIETLLNCFKGDFMEQHGHNKLNTWNMLISVLRNAKKVIFLDAFTSTSTIQFIKDIEKNDDIKIYQRIDGEKVITVQYIKAFIPMMLDIIDKIKQGKKVFVFYPYKNQTTKYPSMKKFF